MSGNNAGGDRIGVPVNLGTVSGIQQRLAVLSRQRKRLLHALQRVAEEAIKVAAKRGSEVGDLERAHIFPPI